MSSAASTMKSIVAPTMTTPSRRMASRSQKKKRRDQCRRAHNKQDIGDIRPDDIADSDIRRVVEDSLHTDQQFRGRGAESNDGQSDYQFGNAQSVGQRHGSTHQRLAPDQEKYKSTGNHQVHHMRFGSPFLFLADSGIPAPPTTV